METIIYTNVCLHSSLSFCTPNSQSIDGEQVSGKDAFQLLLKVLKDEHRSVKFQLDNYHQEVPEKKEELKRI